mmetsp:Transcript_19836/g.50452  ORF Transcript_19836/g.50452 Transcript_19836/m.50452 type:complete len:193 (+) Transcript_19836:113-691(+)
MTEESTIFLDVLGAEPQPSPGPEKGMLIPPPLPEATALSPPLPPNQQIDLPPPLPTTPIQTASPSPLPLAHPPSSSPPPTTVLQPPPTISPTGAPLLSLSPLNQNVDTRAQDVNSSSSSSIMLFGGLACAAVFAFAATKRFRNAREKKMAAPPPEVLGVATAPIQVISKTSTDGWELNDAALEAARSPRPVA